MDHAAVRVDREEADEVRLLHRGPHDVADQERRDAPGERRVVGRLLRRRRLLVLLDLFRHDETAERPVKAGTRRRCRASADDQVGQAPRTRWTRGRKARHHLTQVCGRAAELAAARAALRRRAAAARLYASATATAAAYRPMSTMTASAASSSVLPPIIVDPVPASASTTSGSRSISSRATRAGSSPRPTTRCGGGRGSRGEISTRHFAPKFADLRREGGHSCCGADWLYSGTGRRRLGRLGLQRRREPAVWWEPRLGFCNVHSRACVAAARRRRRPRQGAARAAAAATRESTRAA